MFRGKESQIRLMLIFKKKWLEEKMEKEKKSSDGKVHDLNLTTSCLNMVEVVFNRWEMMSFILLAAARVT